MCLTSMIASNKATLHWDMSNLTGSSVVDLWYIINNSNITFRDLVWIMTESKQILLQTSAYEVFLKNKWKSVVFTVIKFLSNLYWTLWCSSCTGISGRCFKVLQIMKPHSNYLNCLAGSLIDGLLHRPWINSFITGLESKFNISEISRGNAKYRHSNSNSPSTTTGRKGTRWSLVWKWNRLLYAGLIVIKPSLYTGLLSYKPDEKLDITSLLWF